MSSLLSMDIGTKNLHLAEGSNSKSGLSVQKAQSFIIPDGCIKDDYIENPELLAETIREAIKLGNFQAREVVLSINACNAVIRDIDLPQAKPKELDSMIRSELYQTFNVLTTDVIQYKFIEKVTNDNGVALSRYRVVAIDGDLVESYYNLMRIAKLKTIAMDINVNAIDKLFSGDVVINDNLWGDESIMLLDFGDTFTTIYFLSKGKPVFYRHIKIGSKEIEKSISDETFTPISEIQKLKESENTFFGNEEASQKYYTLLKPFFYRFNDEIRKIMGFYSSRASIPPIGHMYLFGQGSLLNGLDDYWESNLNLQVDRIKSLSKVSIGNAEQLLPTHLNAIGALIRY